ncbi:MAG TPA: hypothetical protein VFK47_07015 [Ktedonobacteraceae bacterium]|nr:hypothetical protein [Ktedonobacteraceae bacterium]
MRLYDKLIAAPGTLLDKSYYGSFTNLARGLRQSQCYIMGPDIASACEEVCFSKPSSILSAYKFIRSPYPHIWVEWTPNDRVKERTRQNDKPRPVRMGFYINSTDDGNKGTVTYAWEHKEDPVFREKLGIDEITMNPFGIIFDFTGDEPAMLQYARYIGMDITEEELYKRDEAFREKYRKNMMVSDKWKTFANREKELDAYIQLELSSGIIPLEICQGVFESPLGKYLKPGKDMFESYMEDLSGEFAYTEAFLLMLNTKNKAVSQTKEDLSRLNKARAKKHKMPLKEFIVTDLNLNKTQTTHAGSLGITRAAARRHLVSGHFKTRSSGTYWYSAHIRGHSENSPVARRQYDVHL